MPGPCSTGWLADVDRPELDIQGAVGSLPRAHFLLLRAALAGSDEGELAALVDVPPESVRPLLRIAAAKLGTSLAAAGADPATDHEADTGVGGGSKGEDDVEPRHGDELAD